MTRYGVAPADYRVEWLPTLYDDWLRAFLWKNPSRFLLAFRPL
ncbi:hypothetical protein [Hymenobacter swuensis]|nr:hypothetical protein [Hymenobacter swuensis]